MSAVLTVLALNLTGSSSLRAAILIDDFITPQSSISTASAPISGSTIAAPEAIGGERDLYVDLIQGSTALSLSVNPFGGELLIHDSGAGVQGTSRTVYDGMDADPVVIDPTGLGGVDLSGGGVLDAFRMKYLLADLTGAVAITVYDASDATGNTWSRAELTLPGGIFTPVDVDIPFTDFNVLGSSGAASFSNVGAISVEISNTTTGSLDVLMQSISVVPEPASASLALLGLLGVLVPMTRRRRR